MSDSRWNTAPRGYAGQTAAVDAGLRTYMLRVYNYMAAAVALSGVVAYATFNAAVTTDAAGKTVLTAFGQSIFSGPVMIGLMLGTLGLVFFISFRIDRLQYSTALTLFMVMRPCSVSRWLRSSSHTPERRSRGCSSSRPRRSVH